MMLTEKWLPVVGYEGLYEVSNLGKIRSLGSRSGWSRWKYYGGGELKGCVTKDGYVQVSLRKEGREKAILINVIVAQAFYPLSYRAGLMACHNNGTPGDNRAENIRWDTAKGNAADTAIHGTRLMGERHGMSKLTDAQRREIIIFQGTVSEASRHFGISRAGIRYIRRHAFRYVLNREEFCG